jgi:hypothetical protein
MNGHKGTRIVADINGSRCVFDSCEVALRRKLPGRQNPPPRKSAGTRERPVCVCRTTDAISRRPVRNHKSGSTDVNKVLAAKHLRMQVRGTMTTIIDASVKYKNQKQPDCFNLDFSGTVLHRWRFFREELVFFW